MTQMQLDSPLPQRYLLEGDGIGGRIKVRPEDFLVEELPLYEPAGEGEHLYLFLEKASVSHSELISTVRRHFNVRGQAIGFAGMKDKLAVTRQMISVHLPRDPPSVELPHQRIKVLWAARHRNKLRRGHLAGNRFSIRMRGVDPLKAPQVLRAVRVLQSRGVPNYFGFQRFGYRGNNHVLGMLVVRGDWEGLLRELLGASGSPYPSYQQQRRELFESGQYADALAQWTAADHAERTALRALAGGRGMRHAARAIHASVLGFWISSLQSAIFNRVLDQRLADGMLTELREGDLAYRHDRGHVFRVTVEELANPDLAGRVERLEVSPTGPLWGPGMTRAAGAIDDAEVAALLSSGVSAETFTNPLKGLDGARRSMRAIMRNPEVDSGVDEHGPFIRTAFDLERGAYATVMLREIMKNDDVVTGADGGTDGAGDGGGEDQPE